MSIACLATQCYLRGVRYENQRNVGRTGVEEVQGHKKNSNGRLRFLTKWVDVNGLTWEPVKSSERSWLVESW